MGKRTANESFLTDLLKEIEKDPESVKWLKREANKSMLLAFGYSKQETNRKLKEMGL